jgi:hypothetical protein
MWRTIKFSLKLPQGLQQGTAGKEEILVSRQPDGCAGEHNLKLLLSSSFDQGNNDAVQQVQEPCDYLPAVLRPAPAAPHRCFPDQNWMTKGV